MTEYEYGISYEYGDYITGEWKPYIYGRYDSYKSALHDAYYYYENEVPGIEVKADSVVIVKRTVGTWAETDYWMEEE